MTVELRHLRAFLAVLDELSFTRAADRLGLTQSTLSQTVRALEVDLGVALFTRTTRSVAVTAAGHRLALGVRPALDVLDDSLVRARQHDDAPERLRVGFHAGGVGPIMTEVLQAFSAAHGAVVVELQRLDWVDGADGASAVRAGIADVALLRPPVDLRDITSRVLFRDERVVGLAVWHRLARRAEVSLADLADEPVVTGAAASRALIDFWTVNPRPGGGPPVWGPAVHGNEEMLEHVALGHAVCIAASTVESHYRRPDVVFRPIIDLEPIPLYLVTASPPTPSARLFVDVAADVTRERATRAPAGPA